MLFQFLRNEEWIDINVIVKRNFFFKVLLLDELLTRKFLDNRFFFQMNYSVREIIGLFVTKLGLFVI